MAKKKSGKRKMGLMNDKNKKKRFERFWIEDCRNTKVKADSDEFDMEVLVTRVELTDSYEQPTARKVPNLEQVLEKTATDQLDRESTAQANGGTDSQQQVDKENRQALAKTDPANKSQETPNADTVEPSSGNAAPEMRSDSGATDSKGTDSKGADVPSADHADTHATEGVGESVKLNSGASPSQYRIRILRSQRANRPYQKPAHFKKHFEPLPNGDCGDGITNPFPKDQVADKFWSQRRRLFSQFDYGIKLDKESWYSVTPEAIANHVASYLVAGSENATVLDPFCGVGGNLIAFALRDEVGLAVGVDVDLEKLKMAAFNAQIYGVPKEKLLLIHDNACRVLSSYDGGHRVSEEQHHVAEELNGSPYRIGGLDLLPQTIDTVFLSPPWGGMDYSKVGKRNYRMSNITISDHDNVQVDGDALLHHAAKATGGKSTALFLPRNINGTALGHSACKAGFAGPMVMEQNVLNGKLKTVTTYIGLGST